MAVYEPELMYALDSKGEYADWKNVYNVSGSDVLYCPICLGRVKLWNGQDPNRTYKKQKCFHHIDGICSEESRIHFAYKTWLLEKGSKFNVGETVYEVSKSEIEKIYHTKFGNYRPDITVETIDGKIFYVEIANTSKKTDSYIEKWDELGYDVLELDVNEQLIKVSVNDIPELKMIYSSTTGECHIKHYTNKDYDDLITERKIYWKRNDILKYKIRWEQLDWFWRDLQDFYTGLSQIDTLIESFRQLDPDDQRFICRRMKGKHSSLKHELERNYTNDRDIYKVHLRHISSMIRNLNKEFGYSVCGQLDDTCLFREDNCIMFGHSNCKNYYSFMNIDENTTRQDVYNHFHPIMEEFYKKWTIPFKEENADNIKKYNKCKKYFKTELSLQLKNMQDKMNSLSNNRWKMKYSVDRYHLNCTIELYLLDIWSNRTEIYIQDVYKDNYDILNIVIQKMDHLIELGKIGDKCDKYRYIRIMEDR